ncbi:MAG: hypothetical protein WB770_01320 [Acidimicrobiales bacterium]
MSGLDRLVACVPIPRSIASRSGEFVIDAGTGVAVSLRKRALFDLGRLQFERAHLGTSYSASYEPVWEDVRGLSVR